jgi:hypothetical protein
MMCSYLITLYFFAIAISHPPAPCTLMNIELIGWKVRKVLLYRLKGKLITGVLEY